MPSTRTGKTSFVYVVQSGIAKKRTITLGRAGDSTTQVRSGPGTRRRHRRGQDAGAHRRRSRNAVAIAVGIAVYVVTRVLAYLVEAGVSLWRNRTRSILTMLGMIIGSASIITVFGLSKAATSGIEGTFKSFGTFPIIVQVDSSQTYPERATLHYSDAARVAADLGPAVLAVEPDFTRTWKVSYGKVSDHFSVSATGVYPNDDSLTMSAGRKLDAEDVDSAARVVVVSQSVADRFFPNGDALGKELTMNGGRYTIVGVYNPIKSPFITALSGNDFIAVPYSTFYRAVNEPPDDFSIYPAPGFTSDMLRDQVVASLQHIHGASAQYQVVDAAGFLKGFDNVLNIAGTSLAAIGDGRTDRRRHRHHEHHARHRYRAHA